MLRRLAVFVAAGLVLAVPHFALLGDPGDDLLKKIKVPPAPVLSPKEALASFKVAPGFSVELVAAEPLVEDPVAAAFDADGRLWVAEGDAIPKRISVWTTDAAEGRLDREFFAPPQPGSPVVTMAGPLSKEGTDR